MAFNVFINDILPRTRIKSIRVNGKKNIQRNMFLEGIISLVTTWYAEYQGTHLVTEAVTIAATIKMTAMNVATIRLYLLVSAMSYSSCYTGIKKYR